MPRKITSPQFSQTEADIRDLFRVGTIFSFEGRNYRVLKCAKPRPSSGECKTDIYLLVKSVSEDIEREIKISIKQENADFLENKMSHERAVEIFGDNADDILKKSINSIKDEFNKQALVFFARSGKTGAKTIKLGWKFELMNKLSGKLSGELQFTKDQLSDVYFGTNLPLDKRNATVDGCVVDDSGVANYILYVDQNTKYTLNKCISSLVSMETYLTSPHKIYFACKALNYRAEKDKWDSDRPLSVYVDWSIDNNRLKGTIKLDSPLQKKGNEIGGKLRNLLRELAITSANFNSLKQKLASDVKTFG